MSPLAKLCAPLPDVLDILGDGVNAGANPAAIGFELGLAGSSGSDAAAKARERGASADEPRQQVFQLSELDLQLAFARAGATREDVENQLRAIDDLPPNGFLDLPQLRGRQLGIKHDHIDAGFGRRCGEGLDLPRAEIGRGIGLGPLLQDTEHHLRARGL